MLCIEYYRNARMVSRRFDVASVAEAETEARAYNIAFASFMMVAKVGYYDD